MLIPHAERYSLGSLARTVGIDLPATHRALDDARVAHALYMKMFERAVISPSKYWKRSSGTRKNSIGRRASSSRMR